MSMKRCLKSMVMDGCLERTSCISPRFGSQRVLGPDSLVATSGERNSGVLAVAAKLFCEHGAQINCPVVAVQGSVDIRMVRREIAYCLHMIKSVNVCRGYSKPKLTVYIAVTKVQCCFCDGTRRSAWRTDTFFLLQANFVKTNLKHVASDIWGCWHSTVYTVIYLCDLDHISCIHRCFAVLIWEPKLLAV